MSIFILFENVGVLFEGAFSGMFNTNKIIAKYEKQ